MAFYFGSGARFKENDENNPGPGHYSPKHVEGFKVDPRSPFLGQERFAQMPEEEVTSGHSVLGKSSQWNASSPARNVSRGNNTDKSRQYTWSTMRITELQDELQTVKAAAKAANDRADEDARKHAAEVVRLNGLVKEAEKRESQLQVAFNSTNEQLQDQGKELAKQTKTSAILEERINEANTAAEASKAKHDSILETLNAEIGKVRDELADVSEKEATLNRLLTQLGEAVETKPTDPALAVQAGVQQLSELRSNCESLKTELQVKDEELKAAGRKFDGLEAAHLQLDKAKSAAEATCSQLRADFLEREAVLQTDAARLNEELHTSTTVAKEEIKALKAELTDCQHRLQLETATTESLENRLASTSAECEASNASLELRSIEVDSLKIQVSKLEADFDQYRQAARDKYEQMQTSFDNEHLLCAKFTADLTVSTTECQRVTAKLSDLEELHARVTSVNEQKIRAAEESIHNLNSQLQETTANLAARDNQVDLLLQEQKDFQEAATTAESQIAKLSSHRDTLQSLLDDKSAALLQTESELKQQIEASQKLNREYAEEKDQAAQKESSLLGKLASAEVTSKNLATELAESRSSCELLEQDLKSSQDQLAHAKKEAGASQQEVAALALDVAKHRAEADALSLSLAEKEAKLQETVSKLGHLEEQHRTTQEDLASLRSDHKEAIDSLENSRQEVAASKKQLNESTDQLTESKEKIAAQHRERLALDNEVKAKEESCLEARAECDEVRGQLTDAKNAVENLRTALSIAREQEARSTEAKAAMQSQISAMEQDMSVHLERDQAKTAELTKLTNQKDALSLQIQNLSTKLKSLEQDNASLSESCSSLEENSRSKDREVHDLQLRLDKSSHSEKQMSSKGNTLREELTQQAAKLTQAEQSVEEQDRELTHLRSSCTALEEQLTSVKQERAGLGSQLYAKDEEIQKQDQDIQSLQKEILDITVVLREREQELQALDKQLANARRESSMTDSPTTSRSKAFRDSVGENPDVHELQAQNLEMFEYLHALELRTAEAEATADRKNSQVAELQERLMEMDLAHMTAQAKASEALRLADENTLLAAQMRQMEVNVKELVDTHGLGHSNGKQRIQYHLRLKEELEELRHECMVLLRERFQLEQCIRYMAATSSVRGVAAATEPRITGTKTPVQPLSLRKIHTWATPSKRASLLNSSRGISARTNATSTPTKADLLSSIQDAVNRTSNCAQGFADDFKLRTNSAASPRRTSTTSGSGTSEAAEGVSAPSSQGPERPSVEATILARISAICSPDRTGRSSALLQDKHQAKEHKENGKQAANGKWKY